MFSSFGLNHIRVFNWQTIKKRCFNVSLSNSLYQCFDHSKHFYVKKCIADNNKNGISKQYLFPDFSSCEVKTNSSVLGISYNYHSVDVLDCGSDGKWIKFAQTGSWNYVDEDDMSFALDFITSEEHNMLKDLFLTEIFSVCVYFSVQ